MDESSSWILSEMAENRRGSARREKLLSRSCPTRSFVFGRDPIGQRAGFFFPAELARSALCFSLVRSGSIISLENAFSRTEAGRETSVSLFFAEKSGRTAADSRSSPLDKTARQRKRRRICGGGYVRTINVPVNQLLLPCESQGARANTACFSLQFPAVRLSLVDCK